MNAEDYFRKLVGIPSHSKAESRIADFIINTLTGFGFEYRKDKVGNLLFFKNANTPKLLFACHMDTVPSAVNAHLLEDDIKFYTDGKTALGADDKAGLAVLLDIAEHIDSDRIAILCTVAEEIGLWGSSQIDKSLFTSLDIEGCYTIDAQGKVGAITKSAIGKTRLTIKVLGKNAHAGFAPEAGINAIKIASEICCKIKCGKLDSHTTCNIVSFIAEGSTNVVPDLATIALEVRSNDDIKRFSIIENIIRESEAIANSHNGKLEILNENLYSPYSIYESSPLVARAEKAIENIGRIPVLKDTTGGSDANNLNKLGINSVVLSTGYFNAHSTSEYIEKEEISALGRLVEELIKL